jgi:hypothetical protein
LLFTAYHHQKTYPGLLFSVASSEPGNGVYLQLLEEFALVVTLWDTFTQAMPLLSHMEISIW